MTKKILRSAVAAVVDWFNSEGGPKLASEPAATPPGSIFYGVNTGSTAIIPGARVGFSTLAPSAITYAVAERRLLNDKLKINVVNAAELSQPATLYGTALTPSKPGHISRIQAEGAFWAIVTGSGSFINAAGICQATSSGAAAAIITASAANANTARVALCKKLDNAMLTGNDILNMLNISTFQAVNAVTPTTAQIGAASVVGSVALTFSDTATPDGFPVVTVVECDNGTLAVTTKYLSLNIVNANALTTQNASETVITGVSTTKRTAVGGITAR